MSDSLLARIASEVPGEVRPEALRILCLYCCRIIESDVTKSWLRSVAEPDQVEGLLAVKYYLDDSTMLNNIWRVVHELSYYKRLPKKTTIQAATRHNLIPSDVLAIMHSMNRKDLITIGTIRTFLRDPYNDAEVNYVLEQLKKHFDNVAYNRLKYVSNNDYSRDHVDMIAELRSHAIRLIRRYEIEAESYEHMVRLVARGVMNHGTNLAIRSNRKGRRILQRIVEKPPFRKAWWFDTKKMSIHSVEIEKKAKRELQTNRKLCCEVRLDKDGTVRFAQVEYLYENRTEAVQAKFRYRRGKGGKRRYLIDLTPPIKDDFIPTITSLYRPVGKLDDASTIMTLADVIPSDPVNDVDILLNCEFVKVLNQEADRVLREFTGCVLGQNKFFIDHLENKGLDHSTLNDKRLGTEACRFLGVRLCDVKDSLRNVPQKVWTTNETRKQIYTESSPSQPPL